MQITLEFRGLSAALALPVRLAHSLDSCGTCALPTAQIRSIYKLQEADTLNSRAASLLGKLKIGMEYVFSRSGPLSMAPSQMGVFAKSSPEVATPDLQWHVQPLSLDSWKDPLHPWDGLTAAVCNLRPTSRGSITLTSPDSRVPPAIDPNYLATEEDRLVAARGLRLTRRIMAATPFSRHAPEEYVPGAELTTDEALAKAAGDIGTSIFHPVGTCKLGADLASDPTAVVDARLRVHGVRKLRVADASIMPVITSGNTNSPSVMIGEKASAMLLEDDGHDGC